MINKKKKQIILLVFLIILLFVINYSFIDKALEEFLLDYETAIVEKVIDGDTIVINESSVRLLGINSPEIGEDYYIEAKEFLEELVLNKKVRVETSGKDKYDRTLAYIFMDGKNINLELVEKGFANYYFYSGKDKYSNDLLDAWDTCIKDDVNLCEKSVDACASCISINSKSIINNCDFECDISNWQIKGEGRKEFIFSEQILKPNEEAGFELDLTDSGGSLFLRDGEGGLILWRGY